jgi:hypothetical protein
MSILDDAIREHLELKRSHGADEGELKKLEDEAFGPPQRPDQADPFNEAPTEFLVAPPDAAATVPEVADPGARSGRRPDIADLQEAPPASPATGEGDAEIDEAAAPPAAEAPLFAAEEDLSPAPDAPPPSPTEAAEVPLPPPPDEAPAPPTDEEHPVGEHEIVPDAGPDTDERHAIVDQPTQMFDVQTHMDADVEAAPVEQESPSDEELVDAAQAEPQASAPAPEEPAGPPTEIHEQPPLDIRGPDAEVAGHPPTEEESAEYDFFNEQRLSDELDQALEAPLPPTDEHVAMPQYGDAPPAQPGIFDFESAPEPYEEDPSEEVLRRHDAPEPPSEEYEQPAEEYEQPAEEYEQPAEEYEQPAEEPEPPAEEPPRAAAEPDPEEAEVAYDPDTGHEDVLEDTPRFLEDAPEDDDLWFEQKPPKDFDLD